MVCQSFANVGETPPPSELSFFTAVTLAVISLVATSGNLSVAITIVKDPLSKLHNPFNYFLLSLAVSDLFLGIVSMPLGCASLVQEYLKVEKTLSEAFHMTLFMSGTASLLSLIALSIDRLIAVMYATKYRSTLSGQRCAGICTGIWIFSISFPFLYFAWDYIGYLMFFTHSAIFVALLIIVATQIQTRRLLRKQSKVMLSTIAASAPRSSMQSMEEKERRLQKKRSRLFLLILMFFVCIYIPAVAMTYILHFCRTCDCTFRHALRDLAFLLISSNSCVNPFIYALRVGSFRKSLKATLSWCCRRKSTYITRSKHSNKSRKQAIGIDSINVHTPETGRGMTPSTDTVFTISEKGF